MINCKKFQGLFFIMVLFAVCLWFTSGITSGDVDTDFDQFDKNGDRKIVKEEYYNGMKITTFQQADKNGDGYIEWEEWELIHDQPGAKRVFNGIDENNDKKISSEEYSNAVDKHFNADDVFVSLDADTNGSLSASEFNSRPGLTFFDEKF